MKKDYKKVIEKKALKKEAKNRDLRRKQKAGFFDSINEI